MTLRVYIGKGLVDLLSLAMFDFQNQTRSGYEPINDELVHTTIIADRSPGESRQIRYFHLHHVKYVWDNENASFSRLLGLEGEKYTIAQLLDHSQGLTLQEQQQKLQLYGKNVIDIEVKSYWTLFVEEVFNPFYVFQIFSVILWSLDDYYYYASCVLVLSAISIITSLIQTKKQSLALYDLVASSNAHTVTVCYRDGHCKIVEADLLVPGDRILIPPHGCHMTCDALLLSGNCIVNESMLTGECVPVTKTPPSHSDEIYDPNFHKRHTLFSGTHVIQTRFYGNNKADIETILLRTLDIVTIVVPPALPAAMTCKLAFCKTIADECQPFLQRFQTSKPMTPYLFEAVEKLLRYLMNRCVKPDLMKCTGPKLLSIDTKKSENLILSKNIDIGFATKRLLGETAITVTERQKLEFIHECRSMLTTMIAKLQEKSPLKQKAVRGLSSLDPCVIQHSPQLAQKRFSFLLEELNHANIINDVLAENAKKEYLHFCNLKKSELQEIFRPCDQFSDEVGLDTIYGSFLIGEANYKHLWEVIKICLVLSHGNATVEGGFSVNKSLLVENMHEKTVIAQRHIHDEIQEAGGIKNIHISKKMLDYVRGARKRYHEYLEMKKQEKSEKDKKKAEKRKLDIQVKDLEGKRKKLMMATEEKREAIEVELQELKKKQASLY
uniref:Cation-transporting P-type ATPase N-terminal domain-containing protein n=1 Tax=Timema monikensis TaxID=170555 RepID=A0A7R9E3G8_9NEOP|nr:unnamed protein product [Timema monikensis]